MIFETEYARPAPAGRRGCSGSASTPASSSPPELVDEARRAARARRSSATAEPLELAAPVEARAPPARRDEREPTREETPIRPERFARLVTLAGILIEAARARRQARARASCARTLQITEQELREDIDVLNVVNFGGGCYVLYAEVAGRQIEVDPEPYSDNFARPARLLPLEAKALVAAIDLLGDHLPEGSLASAREKIVDALGQDPAHEGLQITTRQGRRLRDRARRQRRDRRAPAAGDRLLQGERGRVHQAHGRALRLMNGARAGTSTRYDLEQATTRARSGSTGSARRPCSTRASSRARASSPTWTAGRAPARCRRSQRRARLDLARARALGARGRAAWSRS